MQIPTGKLVGICAKEDAGKRLIDKTRCKMKTKPFCNKNKENDTIVAISTPQGIGGIGIVRISGPRAIEIAGKIFRSKGKIEMKPGAFYSHRIYYGTIVCPVSDSVVDEVLLTVMRKPKTYTREDVVEINCHGGYFAVNKVLEIVHKLGARIAEPGEFTKLAFLSGRIDLSQAEAVIDVINAGNEKSLCSSLKHLSGGLKNKIAELKNRIISLNAGIEAMLDFPDQGLGDIDKEKIKKILKICLREVDKLLNTVKYGMLIKEGIGTIILGKTNVGKSSLFNLLLKKNKSIVTPLPGTTRDIIEGTIDIKGLTFNLIDTAGIKTPENIVEKISLQKVNEQMEFASLFLIMFDISQPLDSHDLNLIKRIKSFHNSNIIKIFILNKTDLPPKLDQSKLVHLLGGDKFVKISIKKGIGINALLENIAQHILSDLYIPEEGLVISNKRHQEYLLKIQNSLSSLIQSLREGMPIDLVTLDLRYIINQLANITGESYDDEIIKTIFSRFCIGK